MGDALQSALESAALVRFGSPGLLEVSGPDRTDLLHRLSTNDLLGADQGAIVCSSFLDEKGRMIDYATVLVRKDSLLLFSSGDGKMLQEWIDRYTIMEDVNTCLRTEEKMIVSVFGPHAETAVNSAFGRLPKAGTFVEAEHRSRDVVLVSRSDFGNERIDLILPRSSESPSPDDSGLGGVPVLEPSEWEQLRILKGIPQLPNEINGSFNPYEVNLFHSINFGKGCYIGQEVIARLDTYDKVQRKLVGVVSTDPMAEELPLRLFGKKGREVGLLTSLARRKLVGVQVGLAVVRKIDVGNGDIVYSRSGDSSWTVTDLPMSIRMLSGIPLHRDEITRGNE